MRPNDGIGGFGESAGAHAVGLRLPDQARQRVDTLDIAEVATACFHEECRCHFCLCLRREGRLLGSLGFQQENEPNPRRRRVHHTEVRRRDKPIAPTFLGESQAYVFKQIHRMLVQVKVTRYRLDRVRFGIE